MWVMNQFIEIWKFKKTENLYDNDDVYYCNLGEDNDNGDDVLLKSNYDNTEYDDGGIHMME